jgi:hypothetical protein
MEDKTLISLIWQLAMREHQMLHDVLPVAQEMAACLAREGKPDPAELKRWLEVEQKVHRSFGELSESIAGIEQMLQVSRHNLGL